MTPAALPPKENYTCPSWVLKTLGVQAQALSPAGRAPLDSQLGRSPRTLFCPTAGNTFRALQMVLPARWDWKQSTEVAPSKDISSLSSHHVWALFRSLPLSIWEAGPLKLPQACCLLSGSVGSHESRFSAPCRTGSGLLEPNTKLLEDFSTYGEISFLFLLSSSKIYYFSHWQGRMYITQHKLNHQWRRIEKYNGHISLEKLQIVLIFLCLPAFCIIFSCTSWINVPSNKERSNGGNVVITKFYSDPSKINLRFLPLNMVLATELSVSLFLSISRWQWTESDPPFSDSESLHTC